MEGYESDLLRDWYLLFHYGTPEEILDGVAFSEGELPAGCLGFPSATVAAARWEGEAARALDLGCAVGRSALELSRFSREVVGIDWSESFIAAARSIAGGEPLRYRRYEEAHRSDWLRVALPPGVRPARVGFEQGDAMDLREGLGTFDLVHAANLLCRLAEPARLLERLPSLVKPGGRLVLATPATWLDQYTPAANQPPGRTLDHLREGLEDGFELREVTEIPFLIREHRRKLQLSTSQTSLWIRKG